MRQLYDKLSPLIALVPIVLVVLLITGTIGPSAGRAKTHPEVRPHEYMYLDWRRVNSYLGQVDGGEVNAENLQETTSSEKKANAQDTLGGVSFSSGEQLVKSFVVTKSEADRFASLLSALEAKHSGRWLTTLNARKWCELTHGLNGRTAPDGSMVAIENITLQMPPFMSAYPELRYASFRLLPPPRPRAKAQSRAPQTKQAQTALGRERARRLARAASREQKPEEVFGPAQLTAFRVADESVRGTPRLEQKIFRRVAGRNPRIPFSVTVVHRGPACPRSETVATGMELEAQEAAEATGTEAPREAETKPTAANVLQPKAAESRSKTLTTVRGKAATTQASREKEQITLVLPARFADITGDPSLLSVPLTVVGIVVYNSPRGFGDGTSVSDYWPALSTAKDPLLRELGVQGRYLTMPRLAQRKHLFAALERSLTYEGHVVEIVPIAIYD